MIERLRIKNFRCFEDVELNDLRRFNVVVGENARGKTALLEAIFLLGGVSAELYFRIKHWRGGGERIELATDRERYEGVFRSLFFAQDQLRTVEVELHDPERGSRSLRIYYEPNHVLTLPLGPQKLDSFGVRPITFEWKGCSGKTHTSRVEIAGGQIQMPAFDEPYPATFMNPASLLSPEDSAKRFSELSKQKRLGPIIAALRQLFPEVEDLSLEIESGSHMVFASVTFLDQRLPVGTLSAGISKVVSILLAVGSRPDGLVLVDEMENGLYFETLSRTWSTLLDLCRVNNTQLFVTTHSNECLRALLPEVAKQPDDFCLLRAERYQDKNAIEFVDGRAFEAALEQRVEVR